MEIRRLKSGLCSYKEFVIIDGKRITKTFKRKSDAISWKRRLITERDSLKALGISYRKPIKFDILIVQFLQTKECLAKNTFKDYQIAIDKYIRPKLGYLSILDITKRHVENLKYDLSTSNLSPTRINFILKLLRLIFKYAIETNYLEKNPVSNITLLKIKRREINFWSIDECQHFLKNVSESHYYDFFLVALNTGLRLGELIGLKWDAIDFTARCITVKRTMTRHGLQEHTKSRKIRFVPMNHLIYSTLLDRKPQSSSSEFVFNTPRGVHISYEHFTYRIFNPLVNKVGLKKIRFHDLRATFASNFCMAGKDIYTLRTILGHSSVEVTQQSYAHLNNEYLIEQMKGFEIAQRHQFPESAPQNLRLIKNS